MSIHTSSHSVSDIKGPILPGRRRVIADCRKDAHEEVIKGRCRRRRCCEDLWFACTGEVEHALLVVPDGHLRAHAATCRQNPVKT